MNERIKKIFLKLKKSSIVQLTTGSIIAQAITIIVSPITTRIYTAEQLGIYTLLITVITLFGPVLSAKIEMAIVTEKKEKNIYAIIVLSTIIVLISSVLVTFIYTIYIVLTNQFNNQYIIYLIIILIYLIITGLSNILISYNNRNKDYDIISKVYVIRTTIQNLGLIVFGIMKFSIIGMLLSQVIGSLFGIRKQSKKLLPNFDKLKQVKANDLKIVVKNNYKLAIFTAPATLCNSASYSLINFFISALYGSTIFGYYSLSYRILGIPLSLVSTNVSKVFFERASKEKNETGKFNITLKEMIPFLIIIAMLMIIILEIFAPNICKIIFGKDWIIAGKYIQILVVMFGIRLVVSTITPALVIAKKQSLEMKMQLIFLLVSIVIFLVCKHFKYDIQVFLILMTIMYSLVYIIIYIIIYKLSLRKEVIKNEN